MTCQSKDSLSRIAKAVGKPIYTDERTTNQTRISFARMLIEVNIINPLPNEIAIKEITGRQIKQVISYDWKPKYCPTYSVVGHCCPPKNQVQRNAGKWVQQPRRVIQEQRSKGPIKKAEETSKQALGEGNEADCQQILKTPQKTL